MVIYYTLSHVPVLSKITMSLLLISYLKSPNWSIKQVDIEVEFSEGKLDEVIYVLLPNGLELITKRNSKWGKLNKIIYGLVQSSRQFHMEFKTYLSEKMNLTQSSS